MKALIPMNEFGLMAGKDYVARVDSRVIADVFGKQHYNVLRDIERIVSDDSGLTSEFRKLNFEVSKYTTEQGHIAKCYLLTRDGFTMLVMGYTGEKLCGSRNSISDCSMKWSSRFLQFKPCATRTRC